MTNNNNSSNSSSDNHNQKQRRQNLKNKINILAITANESIGNSIPINQEDNVKYVERVVYASVIDVLKNFADRNFEGKKPEWLLFKPHTISGTDRTQDRFYMPHNEPANHQVMLDSLKNYGIIPEDSTVDDYAFLFNF